MAEIRFDDPRLPERFWAKVSPEPNSGCWLWCAAIKGFGYGNFSFGGAFHSAHKLAYVTLVGPVPDGLELDHKCRVRLCCNPGHLEPVPRHVNMRRSPLVMQQIGRRVGQRPNGRRTACPSGHPFEGTNVAWSRTKGRPYQRCRACYADKAKEHQR